MTTLITENIFLRFVESFIIIFVIWVGVSMFLLQNLVQLR